LSSYTSKILVKLSIRDGDNICISHSMSICNRCVFPYWQSHGLMVCL